MTPDPLAPIAARAEKATPTTTEHIKRARYDHGGGRMYRAIPLGVLNEERTLIVDTYNLGDREFYFHALEDVQTLLAALRAAEARVQELDRYLTSAIDDYNEQKARAEAAEQRAERYREVLDLIASWAEGPEVTNSFDEPGAARVARHVLQEGTR